MPGAAPLLTIQTASLYASNDASTFTGTGGPFGFSPFTSQFGGIISSAGLSSQPFNDTVYTVATGDEVELVIAVQNMGAANAYGIDLKDLMPTGFVVPTDGIGLTVTDGLGNDLATSGNLFSSAGLTITPSLGAYDPNSGQNVDLVTFSLDAGTALPGPYASLTSSASIAGYAATVGGANLAPASPASAATTVITAAPIPAVTPETDPSAVAAGQTVSFDVSVAIPTGTLNNVSIGTVLPTGSTSLSLVSASVISVGAGLQAGTPTVGANGTINFGTITHSATATGDNTIDARITVRAGGTVSGTAALQTVVSAADPALPGGVWSANVSSSVGVVAPPAPPTLSGINAGQASEIGQVVDPLAWLSIADANPNQVGTLAISLQDGTLGKLGDSTVTAVTTCSLDPTACTFYATGTLSSLQAAAHQLQFTPTVAGTAHFVVTVVDAAGGVAQDANTAVSVVPQDPLFNAAWYLAQNPDVAAAGVDAYQHYLNYGWKEGRDPNPYFDTNYYLTQNPDVKAAGVDPLLHFEEYGWYEGRQPSLVFSDAQYNAVYTDVAAARVDPLLHYVLYGQTEGRMAFIAPGTAAADPLVNPTYYDQQLGASMIPAGTAGVQQAAWSYATTGWQKGLNPDQFFNSAYYLAHNPDVAAAHVDPLLHYEAYGWKEGRNPSALFDTNRYLNANLDVKAANVDPLLHYVEYGMQEGRAIYAAPT